MRKDLSKEARSRIMRSISKRDTTPERKVRRLLHAQGLRFRLHVTKLPGKPDIVLPRFRVVVLVHGCFWHQHPGCRHAIRPRVNRNYWLPKLRRNVLRDKENIAKLRTAKWRAYVVWECQITEPRITRLATRIRREMQT